MVFFFHQMEKMLQKKRRRQYKNIFNDFIRSLEVMQTAFEIDKTDKTLLKNVLYIPVRYTQLSCQHAGHIQMSLGRYLRFQNQHGLSGVIMYKNDNSGQFPFKCRCECNPPTALLQQYGQNWMILNKVDLSQRKARFYCYWLTNVRIK